MYLCVSVIVIILIPIKATVFVYNAAFLCHYFAKRQKQSFSFLSVQSKKARRSRQIAAGNIHSLITELSLHSR